MLTAESPEARSRALAGRINTLRESIELAIRGADELRKPVPPVVRQMPANLGAWAKMCERGGS